MNIIKQIKICAEYRGMVVKASAGLSGTHELGPIGLSPGSLQNPLGFGYHVPAFCTDLSLYIRGLSCQIWLYGWHWNLCLSWRQPPVPLNTMLVMLNLSSRNISEFDVSLLYNTFQLFNSTFVETSIYTLSHYQHTFHQVWWSSPVILSRIVHPA